MPAAGTLDSVYSRHGSFLSRHTAEVDAGLSINGKAVLVDDKLFKDHTDGKSTHNGKAVSGRLWFTINGKGIVCVNDQVSCGSTVATGDAGFQVN